MLHWEAKKYENYSASGDVNIGPERCDDLLSLLIESDMERITITDDEGVELVYWGMMTSRFNWDRLPVQVSDHLRIIYGGVVMSI